MERSIYNNIQIQDSMLTDNNNDARYIMSTDQSLYSHYSEFWLKMMAADRYDVRSKLLVEFQLIINNICNERDAMKTKIDQLEYTIYGLMSDE